MNKIILGNTILPSNVILAPMAGVTDLPFRKIVREFGKFLMFSEMIASNAVIRHVARTYKMIEDIGDEYTSVQIVGADPNVMATAAKLCQSLGAKFLDINMGCPMKKIVKSEAGAALMRNENLAKEIMEKIVKAVTIPVSLKIRLGWDKNYKNAKEIAKIAENSGISMLSVHGRTRSEFYSGSPDWKAIGEIKNSVKKIPVIANGNIVDIESANMCLKESGADGVMVGRGALGSPWILKQIHDDSYNSFKANKVDIIKRHIQYVLEFYGESRAIYICRKVLMYYSKGIANAASLRRSITLASNLFEINQLIKEIDN